MTVAVTARADLFRNLSPQPADGLLALIKAFRDDPNPSKIDLGIGVYRDESGATPVFASVKAAEAILRETQATKAYLGPEGDLGFVEAIAAVAFGAGSRERLAGVQTPGGTGALRLAAELIKVARPGARIWVGAPTWPNHGQIFSRVGLETVGYRGFDPATQSLRFDETLDALERAEPGDVALLHGCCHNPTGADFSRDQWSSIADTVASRGVVPLIDLAYQGLGEDLEADAAGPRLVLAAADEALVAYSCDKNFGLYRERVGALYAKAGAATEIVRSNVLQLARCAWSMPPDHGAAVARVILEDEALTADWRRELSAMCARLRAMRLALADAVPELAALRRFNGLFSQLPLDPDTLEALRRDHGVYIAGGGRINIAGLNPSNVDPFAHALRKCAPGDYA